MPSLFEAQVSRHPRAVAVRSEDRSLTYAELNAEANRLAAHLRGVGVGAYSLAGIYLQQSIEAVVAVLASLKAGAAYLPLDPEWTAARLGHVLGDARAQLVMTDGAGAKRLRGFGGHLIRLDEENFSGYGAENPHGSAEPDHLAYVHYPEGAQARGVLVTQQNVAGFFQATEKVFRLGPGEVWAQTHGPGSHLWGWEIFGALLHGGTLVIVPEKARESGAVLRELLETERVTVWTPTSESFLRLQEAEEALGPGEYALRQLILEDEILPGDVRRWLEGHGAEKPQCLAVHGCAETTMLTAFHRVTQAAERGTGRVLPGVQVHLVDERGRKAAPGALGEILVGGVGVARGYLHDPALTDRCFVADPAQPGTSARLYRTGELARVTEDGEIEFLGRKGENPLLEAPLQAAA